VKLAANVTLSLATVDSEEEWGDPCHELAHSVLFFLIVFAATVGWALYVYTSVKT
jgi:hypothetical protein